MRPGEDEITCYEIFFTFPKGSVAEFSSNSRLMPEVPHVGPYDSYYRHARLFFSPYLLINQPKAVGGRPLLWNEQLGGSPETRCFGVSSWGAVQKPAALK